MWTHFLMLDTGISQWYHVKQFSIFIAYNIKSSA